MKLFESFRSAADKYGEDIARAMLNAGIPDKYILAACRFHCEPPQKSIDELSVKFRQWMTYVIPVKNEDVNKKSYEEFDNLIQQERSKCICPNQIYNDGQVAIGRFLSKNDAIKCPLTPIGGKTEFCVCGADGYNGYNSYTKNGNKMGTIYVLTHKSP